MEFTKYNAIRLGRLIREARQHQRISQAQLGIYAGADRSYVGRVERGQVNLTVKKLCELADILDVDPRSLIPSTHSE